MLPKRKCKTLSVEEKLQLIKAVDERQKMKSEIAKDFGIPANTLSTILKNREKYEELSGLEDKPIRRTRSSPYENIDRCVLEWLKQCHNKNITIGGPILKQKAIEFSEQLGLNRFCASNGWLENFKKRHGIFFRKACDESAKVNKKVDCGWMGVIANVAAVYKPDDNDDADETESYFKSLLDKTITFKNDPCHGGNNSEDHVKYARTTHQTFNKMGISYLNQTAATNLDLDLFNEYKFSVDQLMELAGLSCASAIAKSFTADKYKKVLVVCGPGNNGGDGLVAARHLHMMGYSPSIYYPKRTAKTLYENLTHQCEKYGIQFLNKCPTSTEIDSSYDIVVDALFGFSFKPPIRQEMLPIMQALADAKIPLCSVDIPSGWNVDNGPPSEGPVLSPAMLISLSAPKKCAEHFTGQYHYLGGRFIPPGLITKYNLKLPAYEGADQFVLLKKLF